jgi:cobalt-zinc-cadmium efflux system outer membrane protein
MCFPVLLFLALSPTAVPPPSTPFDEAALASVVWQRAPDVLAARRDLIDAEAVRDRTHLLPNPTLTGTWGTIPLGKRTGDVGFWDVPNYNVGIAELFEIGKRGPRQRAAEAARNVQQLDVHDVYLRTFFAVLEAMSDQAAATARLMVLQRLVNDSQESLRLQRARADKGDIAPLEVDRLEVEHSRLLSSMRDAEATRQGAIITCGGLLGAACPQFASEEEARRFLMGRPAPTAITQTAIEGRPDIKALGAEKQRLQAELTLAERTVIPDPVASVGYTHDQFVAAGNQSNSLNLSVTIPLPFFDRGQTEAARARSRLANNDITNRSLRETLVRAIADQQRQLGVLEERARDLDQTAVPRARRVVELTEAAFRRGGVGFPEVLLARRAFEELELDRIDVASAAHRAGLNLRRATAALPWPAGAPVATTAPARTPEH